MRKNISITKMVASGNDFVLIDQRRRASIRNLKIFAIQVCDRKYGAGADGLLIEVHNNPEEAFSDGSQSLIPDKFEKLVSELKKIAKVLGREI